MCDLVRNENNSTRTGIVLLRNRGKATSVPLTLAIAEANLRIIGAAKFQEIGNGRPQTCSPNPKC